MQTPPPGKEDQGSINNAEAGRCISNQSST
uniref:Uncharacterized protein n=1 Tax=Moniliophthora roreri TaxID=221103 RepID=A0A0W0F4R1_MONRR